MSVGYYETQNDDTLLGEHQELLSKVLLYTSAMGRIEMILRQRLEERGATEIPHPSLTVKLESRFGGYDTSKLMPLKELVAPDVWAEAFTPAHDKIVPVPDSLDARKAGGWGKKYGKEVADVIEKAELPRTVRLVIKEKEVKA